MPTPYHIPVLLTQAIEALDIKKDGVYVDVTFGGGGHTAKILENLGSKGKIISFDQDIDAMGNIPGDDRFIFVRSNFSFVKNFLRYHGITEIDGLLADLGVSSHHFDCMERGFSFRDDAPLDMRMNVKAPITAAHLLATADEERLAYILKNYGELDKARNIASAITKERKKTPIDTTLRLKNIVVPFLDPRQEKKDLAKIFQALRIEVNDELGALRKLLEESVKIIKPGGRLVIIAYHSLEDRMVKNFLKTVNVEGKVQNDPVFGTQRAPFKPLSSKPVVADAEEVAENPRARSARMRVGIRL